MAGQATCEMPMLKVDGKWIAKGMSCNGGYFTPEQAKERRKMALIKSYKGAADKSKRKASLLLIKAAYVRTRLLLTIINISFT